MSYLDRLKAEISGKCLPSEPTKPTKAPSVSFVGSSSRHISSIGASNDGPLYTGTETRRVRVLGMLAERPRIRYAVVVDNPHTDPVIVAIAIRGTASAEIEIDRARYDGLLLLEILERHTLH